MHGCSSTSFNRTLFAVAPRLSRRWFLTGGSCQAELQNRSTTSAASTKSSILSYTKPPHIRNGVGRDRVGSKRQQSLLHTFENATFRSHNTRHSRAWDVGLRGLSIHRTCTQSNSLQGSRRFSSKSTGLLQDTIAGSSTGTQQVVGQSSGGEQAEKEENKRKGFFPETSTNAVAYWLLASAASVFGIVVFGGLTRLTESGLSITEWRPVTGSLPPLSEEDWETEFAKYQASPEFKVLNSRMNLEEFKSIYWMEWIHRIWGRAVGLTFILPAAYFIARGRVSKSMMYRLGGIGGLIGFQGFIGWWMVKSGLKDDFLSPDRKPGRDVPRVSQYRLAAHLGTAFVCYLAMLWNGLSILRTNKLVHNLSTDAASSQLFALRNPALRPFKISVALLAGLVFTTAMSGALVAGLDAGLIYNEFPYMGLGLTPPKSELFNPFYSHTPGPDHSDLVWRNALENPSLVQLDHRILATTTFTSVMALWAYSRYSQNMRSFLPRAAVRGVHGVVGFVWLQVILGISTLIYMVPIPLASAHQAGALALLTWTTVLGSRIWFPRYAARIIEGRTGAGANTLKQLKKKSKYDIPYDFPAIPKVKPNLGRGTGGGEAIQAGMSAVGAAVGSALMASAILQHRKDKDKDDEKK